MTHSRSHYGVLTIGEVRESTFSVIAVKPSGDFSEMGREAGSGPGRRRWDSNPRRLFTLHDFQSCSLGHYETPPGERREWDSNPRGLAPYRFSRAALSTTQTSLHGAV